MIQSENDTRDTTLPPDSVENDSTPERTVVLLHNRIFITQSGIKIPPNFLHSCFSPAQLSTLKPKPAIRK